MNTEANKIAIVTGASRGIGAAVAERHAQDGFSVVVNYTGSEAEASALAKKIRAGGGRSTTAQADVANRLTSRACSTRPNKSLVA